MVVLLQELKVEAVSDFTSQDRLKLLESLGVLAGQAVHHTLGERLMLVIEDIEGNLVGNQVVCIVLNEAREEGSCGIRNVQEELALDDLIVIEGG